MKIGKEEREADGPCGGTVQRSAGENSETRYVVVRIHFNITRSIQRGSIAHDLITVLLRWFLWQAGRTVNAALFRWWLLAGHAVTRTARAGQLSGT